MAEARRPSVASQPSSATSMEAWSLASGSSGNAYLIKSGHTTVLVDCGLSVRRLQQSLASLHLSPHDLSALFLTHAHCDHLGSSRALSEQFGVPVLSTAGTLSHPELRDTTLARALTPGVAIRIGDLEAVSFRVPHDCIEPVGYRFTGDGGDICLVTDLGHVPDPVLPMLSGVRLLIAEANHDPGMLQGGPYHTQLKRRVAGELGHLSNQQLAEALARCDSSPPEVLWLAHLSLVNNRPTLAKDTISQRLSFMGLGHVAVQVAARNHPSLHWLGAPRPDQLSLW